jgi:predicted RNase H-like HicB family nuclease
MKIALLVLAILEKVIAIVAEVMKAPAGKTPEQVRQEIKDAIDSLDDAWLEQAVKDADAKFGTPG